MGPWSKVLGHGGSFCMYPRTPYFKHLSRKPNSVFSARFSFRSCSGWRRRLPANAATPAAPWTRSLRQLQGKKHPNNVLFACLRHGPMRHCCSSSCISHKGRRPCSASAILAMPKSPEKAQSPQQGSVAHRVSPPVENGLVSTRMPGPSPVWPSFSTRCRLAVAHPAPKYKL